MCSYRPSPLSLTLLKDIIDLQFYYSNRVTLENRPLLDKEGAVIGDFQEEQCHLLLISQHNSMLNLLCTHYQHEHNQKFYSIMTLKCKTAPYLVMPRLILKRQS